MAHNDDYMKPEKDNKQVNVTVSNTRKTSLPQFIIVAVALCLLFYGLYSLFANQKMLTNDDAGKHWKDSVIKSYDALISQKEDTIRLKDIQIQHYQVRIAQLDSQYRTNKNNIKELKAQYNEKVNHLANLSSDDLVRFFTDRYQSK